MKTEVRGSTSSISLQNPSLLINPSPQNSLSVSGALHGCLGSLDGACIEKLLLHCASALENNDVTLAQQVMWVLNNVASSSGDPNQRLTSWFLRALISRASRVCPTTMKFNEGGSSSSTTTSSSSSSSSSSMIPMRLMSVMELAEYVDLIPWHRFGFCASNSAIFKATLGSSRIHIIDFSITHCMQWPTLIDALAKRPQGTPALRISVVPAWRPPVPPFLNVSTEEVGQRLANFAKFKEVPFEFSVIDHHDLPSNKDGCSSSFHYDFLLSMLNPTALDLREDEALVINCQNWLRYLPDECQKRSAHDHDQHHQIMNASSRDVFLDVIKGLDPRIITVVDEDSDLGVSSLTSRITTCFNFLWIPFDALETFLSKDNAKRIKYEADIGQKIENIIGFEGGQRVERLESGMKLSQRMKDSGFFSIPFCEESVREVKELLDEHASGWGMKNEQDMLVLTWKGHNSVYATAWVPAGFEEIN